nr:MAG TPA: hypothetical protein [Caudoviricetes sp.]
MQKPYRGGRRGRKVKKPGAAFSAAPGFNIILFCFDIILFCFDIIPLSSRNCSFCARVRRRKALAPPPRAAHAIALRFR